MTLADENTSVMDGLSVALLLDDSLKTTVQEILNLDGEDGIERKVIFGKDAETNAATDEGGTFENAARVLAESRKATKELFLKMNGE